MTVNNRAIRRWLTAAVLSLLGVLWGLTYVLQERARELELREANSRMEGKAAVFAEYVRSVFGHLDAVLVDLRDHIRADMTLDTYEAGRHLRHLKGYAGQLSILDAQGALSYSSSRPQSHDQHEHGQFRFFSEGGSLQTLHISLPVKGQVADEHTLFVARPIIGNQGLRGLIRLSISPDLFTRFVSSIATRPDDVFAVVRSSGEILATYPRNGVPLGTRVTDSPILEPDAPSEGTFRRNGVDGTPRFFAYKALPEYGLIMVTGRSQKAVLSTFETRRQRLYASAAVISLAMLSLLWALRWALNHNDRMQQQLRLAASEAEAASREKSVFLSTMSHELRTPLNGVVGLSQLLLDTPLNARQREFATGIAHSGQAVVELVNEILDLAKIESGQINLRHEAFDLVESLEMIRALFAPRAAAQGLGFTLTIDPAAQGQFVGDIARIRQVLINLVGNALKFTEQGDVAISVSASSEGLTLCVSDTGIGVAPSERERIFERFTQIDPSLTRRQEGTGLGLAICRDLVGLMGGRIVCEGREPQPGALMRVELPLQRARPLSEDNAQIPGADAAPMASAARPSHPLPDDGGPRLLVVEDNPVNQRVLMLMLERLGYRHVDLAQDGAAALAAADQRPYALVLMDVRMPDLDGMEVTRRLRASQGPNRNVSVVAVTANALQEDRDACLAAGMNDFLSKPLQIRDLAGCMQRWAQAPATGSDG